MKSLVFHPEAAQEANDAVDYYDDKRAGLGDDFRAELRAALVRIQGNPGLYGAEGEPLRVCPRHRFPYCVYYKELADRIWVAAVGHQRRRPNYWSSRRPS